MGKRTSTKSLGGIPRGRHQAQEVADLINFLASRSAASLSGSEHLIGDRTVLTL